jgi:uncharacterized protein (TIGR03083 family)
VPEIAEDGEGRLITVMSPSGWVDYFGQVASQIINVASQRLEARVPSCPEWVGRDLVAHVATCPARWSLLMAIEPGGSFPPPQVLGQYQKLAPHADETLISWSHEKVSAYAQRLHETDPAAPAWSYTPDQTMRFWMRRAALEAAVHLADAQGLIGEPGGVPPALAADGLDELVDTYPLRFAMGGSADVHPLVVHATDAKRTWTLSAPGSSDAVDREVSGRAGDFFLRLWGRQVDASFSGDVDALNEWAALASGMG